MKKKQDFFLQNVTNKKIGPFFEKKKNFENLNFKKKLFLSKIKRVNFFWKGTNPSFPFIFKKIFKVNENFFFQQIDFAQKKTKTI